MFRRGVHPASTVKAASPAPVPAPDTGRTAPEPLSLVLPALAALGAIASIAAVAWVAQDRTIARPRVKRRIDVILRDLEISSLGLAEILRRIRRNGHLFGVDGPNGAATLKFGLAGQRVDGGAGHLYHQLVNDLATMLVLATQNSFDAVNAIEDGEIEAPEQVFYGFGDAQERLNVLLMQRAGVRALVDGGLEIAEQLAGLVRQLKQYKTG